MLATPRKRAQEPSPSNKRRAENKKKMGKNMGAAAAGNGVRAEGAAGPWRRLGKKHPRERGNRRGRRW